VSWLDNFDLLQHASDLRKLGGLLQPKPVAISYLPYDIQFWQQFFRGSSAAK
jgi:hypothetical protein